MLPLRLGKFTLTARIASGGMAEVFLAHLEGVEGFSKLVAVKRLLPHLAKDAEFLRLLVDEAKLSAQLVHPNIVQVQELGAHNGDYFIAMEYVAGTDLACLRDYFQTLGERIPTQVVLGIANEVLSALAYAHGKCDAEARPLHIVHRDVSPSNVLLSDEGVVKLADFGIAKAAMRLTQTVTGYVRGKYAYLSPEQASGQAVDARSDVFGFALVLYELLVGRRAYDAGSELEVLEQAREAKIPPLHQVDLPVGVSTTIMRALARQPSERWQSAEAFRLALNHAAQPHALAELVKRLPARESASKPPVGLGQTSPDTTPSAPVRLPREPIQVTVVMQPRTIGRRLPIAVIFAGLVLASLPAIWLLKKQDAPLSPEPVTAPAALPELPAALAPPSQPSYGYLAVNSRPWGYVFVDGEKMSRPTPIKKFKLTQGRHQVRVVCPQLQREQVFAVDIERDATFTQLVVFDGKQEVR